MNSRRENLEVIRRASGFDFERLNLELGESLRVLPGRRDVFRAKLIDLPMNVVVKCYLPHAKQARDWKREWDGLVSLQELGLPAPKPLAVCRNDLDEVCVLMEELVGALSLGDFLEDSSEQASRSVLEKLVHSIDSQHEMGAYQSDQHIDNWAVCQGEIFLLDAGTFRFKREPLCVEERVADLAAICVVLPPVAEGLFREFIDLGYSNSCADTRARVLGDALEGAIIDLQQERARRYYKKTQRSCTEFDVKDEAQHSGMYLRKAEPDLIRRFFTEVETLMSEGKRLKSGNTCTVQQVEQAGRRYVIKRYNKKPWFTQFRRSLFPSRARLSWANAWVLNLAFIPTAKALAFYDESGFPRGRSYLLMEAIEGELLPDFLDRISDDAGKLSSLVEEFGGVWDALGRLRAAHGDMKATNWMVDSKGKVYLFDLDAFRFGLSGAPFSQGREKDRNRFLKNWESQPELANAFRNRMKGGWSA